MKRFTKFFGLFVAALSTFLTASASLNRSSFDRFDFEVDDIFYNITDPIAKEVEVTSASYYGIYYVGDVEVPTSVTHEGEEYTVTGIGDSAFLWCQDLNSVTIPNSVTTLKSSAFRWCSSMTSITIPNSVTSIGGHVFYECGKLTSITLSNSVTSIGQYAFHKCVKLTSITLPSTLKSIGTSAFGACKSLTSITSFAVTPPECDSYAFNNVNKQQCNVYVPAESVEAYKQAPQWQDFANSIAAIVSVSEIRLNKTIVNIEEGTTFQLTAEVLPEDATNKALQWESTDESCVTVDNTGLLTAKAIGSTTITVRSADGNAMATCLVKVSTTTGVVAVEVGGEGAASVFNLMGVKVADSPGNLPTGIYIVNGRKVIVR